MLAPAKLNLALHVTGQRADSYHTLHSLVAFADVGDEISASPSDTDQLTVDGPFADGVPPLADNTLGAALALVRHWGEARDPVRIHLTKNLPVASGIGGGSADAAALIRLLTRGRDLSASELADCLALGADVPMCLAGTPAIVSGIGEERQPASLPAAHVVLVNPGVGVSTPDVFKALDQKSNAPMPEWPKPASFEELVDYLQITRNDLMAPAIGLEPQISNCLDALTQAPFARMSGSGATCFALLETADDAAALAQKVANGHPDWWVTSGALT
ncbi:MAG: 4-(cytidine 5'-diphospho)-2-C-methyl-D-erythritol kinase [Rhizobiales bacterium]|nr:4-(cytidine 5'-diphospho)-2-C-methyl-D-erythritol kinase [Hyphomicrobiales bacterium]MBO6700447.1 4-(cytidine 5'-diphospho)-2-C-methyl-D-erythritol kinase [Hyphomicrobiales bacterium]MBO6737983.1 4-(cytidine 5'-diphospho)-2-C-methyl-D-erythritol kinase [Hyphomicrobiales bacterium]MBO6913710.1 4-(cytidine 5'-diphospho)-2-C-methyl-D-erythritol kinase [Hyphomicrobiales bacterium]MBO6954394.1 4-(cytidine 5'-diphospho)-2-C-methyl-D-erythritol kinase [Hyphomicrobiales bacterium]